MRGQVGHLAARGLLGAVAGGDVRDLVRHHARQFRFVVGFQDQPGVDEEEAAGKREGVHFFGVDHLDGERNLASELRTRFWPTRFTYSAMTGSSMILAWRSTSCASSLPSAISFSIE